MTQGTKVNSVGMMSARADGAIPACRFVKPAGVNADGMAEVALAVTAKAASVSDVDRVIGVSAPDTDAATTDTVQYYSIPGSLVLVEIGAAVATDKDLMVDASGRAIEATYTAGQTTQLVGRSTEAGATLGDFISILFYPQLASVGTSGDDLAVADDLTVGGDATFSGRVLEKQGADVASANNLVLGDGNVFEVTGVTEVQLISNLTWQNGSLVTLLFTSTPTVKHNTATVGTDITILLEGAADFVAAAGDSLTLVLCEIGGTQAWREVARKGQISTTALVATTLALSGNLTASARVLHKQGADVASANDLVLGSDGNVFEITGVTQINHVSNLTWQNGAEVTLYFTGVVTVDHNNATAGTNIVILLDGAVDFVSAAGDMLKLTLCEIGGTQAWRESGRMTVA